MPSLARSASARFAASGGMLLFGTVTSIITARGLGPSGKGTLSALFFISDVILFHLCGLGMGEAATLLAARNEVSIRDSLRRSLIPLGLASAAGAGALLLVAFPANWGGIISAVLIQSLVLCSSIYLGFFSSTLLARERFNDATLVTLVRGGGVMVGTAIFVALAHLGLLGGVLGGAAGVGAALFVSVRLLRRDRFTFRPQPSVDHVRRALRFGIPLQVSHLLIALSQRFDQLIVYQVAGMAAGGRYAVALTIGQLAAYAPFAVSLTSFPRIASASDEEAISLIGRVSRVGTAAALLGGVLVASATPFVLPLLYGDVYRPAVGPALLLTLGGVIWSTQWILCRAVAARGKTSLIVISFGINLVVMVSLAYLLTPTYGIVGASTASVAGALSGIAVCAFFYVARWGIPLRHLLPARPDFIDLFEELKSILSQFRGGLWKGRLGS